MTDSRSGDETWIVGIFKREWTSLKGSWRSFTEDMVRREYIRQFEANGAKAEANGAALAAHGINAEVTGIKFEKTFFDPIAALEKRKEEQELRSRNLLPTQLRSDITRVRGEAGQAMNKAKEVERSVTSLRRDRLADLEDISDEFETVGDRVTALINSLGGL
ncbi:hypothetical protein [Streptomyces sp. NPDC051286]|uniref:hypothetical protein n=1 Tax=Streptomyces sp. NPDC051286 TaxID=3365647 RepID=UPI003789E7DE